MSTAKNNRTAKTSEIELLKLRNAMLVTENKRLLFREAQKVQDALVIEILAAHGFGPDARIRMPDGVIEDVIPPTTEPAATGGDKGEAGG